MLQENPYLFILQTVTFFIFGTCVFELVIQAKGRRQKKVVPTRYEKIQIGVTNLAFWLHFYALINMTDRIFGRDKSNIFAFIVLVSVGLYVFIRARILRVKIF